MFLHNFVMKGLLESIGKMPDYWVINSSLNWYDKGILTQEDLEQINEKLTPAPVEEEEIIGSVEE